MRNTACVEGLDVLGIALQKGIGGTNCASKRLTELGLTPAGEAGCSGRSERSGSIQDRALFP